MKKWFLVFVLICFRFQSIFAQSKLALEFRTGVLISSMHTIKPLEYEYFNNSFIPRGVYKGFYDYEIGIVKNSKIGISSAFLINYRINDSFQMSSGFGYSERGLAIKEDNRREIVEAIVYPSLFLRQFSYFKTVDNRYLNIPLMLKYYLGKEEKFYVVTGVYFDLLAYSNINTYQSYTYRFYNDETSQIFQNGSGAQSYSVKSPDTNTSKFDFGFVLGSGLKLPINRVFDFSFEITLNNGLVKVDSKNDNQTTFRLGTSSFLREHENYYGINSDAKNIGINSTVSLTYKLRSKGKAFK